MDVNSILDYLAQYGVIFIFVIVFLEYLNLPGLPAGIIMPLAGLWISRGNMNFPFVLFLSVIAVFITWLGFNSMAVKLIAQVVVIVLNYIISKLIVFKK